MVSELDTDAFFAYAKAHHRDLVQQADSDALRRGRDPNFPAGM